MKSSSFVELNLDVILPIDYKDFLDEIGYICLENISQEIYGYKKGFDIYNIPCVIAATKNNKKDYNLDSKEIVISHAGYQDRIVILDTRTSYVFELSLEGHKKKLADSFSGWYFDMLAKNKINN
jgi:hypothetical protein